MIDIIFFMVVLIYGLWFKSVYAHTNNGAKKKFQIFSRNRHLKADNITCNLKLTIF